MALVSFGALPPHLHAPLSPAALAAVAFVFEFAPARGPARPAPAADRVVFACASLADVLRAVLSSAHLGLRVSMATAAANAMEPGSAAAGVPRTRATPLTLPLYCGACGGE